MIWECAGIVGVDPGPFTLRQLSMMADGRAKLEWGIASSAMALLANCNRSSKGARTFRPEDFNPLLQARQIVHDTKEAFRLMKKLWVQDKGGKK